METIIATIIPYISSSALPLVVVVIAVVWIQAQRKDTGKKRDEFQALTNYRLDKIEQNQGELSESIKELKDSVIALQLSVNTLTVELKNRNHNG